MIKALNRLTLKSEHHGHNRFVADVLTIATGTFAAQAISFGFTPLLTRIYGPDSFGAMAAFMALLNIISPMSTLGFSSAIVIPAERKCAAAVARLSLLSAGLVTVLSTILVWTYLPHIADATGLESNSKLLYLIPVSVLIAAFLSVGEQMAIREGIYRIKATAYVTSTLISNVGKLAFGLLTPVALTLILNTILGRAVNGFFILWRASHSGHFDVRSWCGTTGIFKAAKAHGDFAIYRMPQSVINAASFGLPVILLTMFFNPAVAGQYSVTTLLLSAPAMLLGQSVAEVFFPKFTIAIRSNPIGATSLLQRATVVMSLLSIIPFGLIALYGDIVFPYILGDEWGKAGTFSQWVSLWMASMLISRPAVSAMAALGLQRALLIYEIAITALRAGSLFVGYRLGSEVVAVGAFSLVNVVGYVTLILFVLSKARMETGEKYV